MQLFTFGINHQTAPLAVREQIAFNVETLDSALRDLVDNGAAKEATILSTCNRTEIYCSTNTPVHAVDWLASYHHLPVAEIEPYIYRLPQEQAVKHAFRGAVRLRQEHLASDFDRAHQGEKGRGHLKRQKDGHGFPEFCPFPVVDGERKRGVWFEDGGHA